MKSFAFLLAVALFALAVPASAGEISEAAFLTTLAQQTEAPLSSVDLGTTQGFRPPHCYATVNTMCPVAGATTVCRDACGYPVNCVCTSGAVQTWSCGVMC